MVRKSQIRAKRFMCFIVVIEAILLVILDHYFSLDRILSLHILSMLIIFLYMDKLICDGGYRFQSEDFVYMIVIPTTIFLLGHYVKYGT